MPTVRTAHYPKLGLKLKNDLPRPHGVALLITPVMDVLFLLLIFFMLGSSLVFQPGITVDAPQVDEPVESFADKLVITLTKEHLLFFNDQLVYSMNDLASKLDSAVNRYNVITSRDGETIRQRSRQPIIILKADKAAPYDRVVQIMSIARKYGAKVFLVTEAANPP